MGEQRILDALRRRLTVAACDDDRVLERVDGDRYVDLVLGETPLGHEVRTSNDVGVGEVEPVDPDPASQYQPVLVAVDRGEDLVASLERGLVGDVANLGDEVDRRVVAHARDESLPNSCLILCLGRIQRFFWRFHAFFMVYDRFPCLYSCRVNSCRVNCCCC